jgi:anthranilate/para-aminobenzoate synthase component I
VYSGALGRIGLDRTLDLSVVIRTLVLDDGGAHFHVGGAIVAESDPDAEHQETLDKAATLADALGATP